MSDVENDRLEKLRRVPLFADLSDEALARVAACAHEFEAAPGHVLIAPNQSATGLFVIEEGSAVVEIKGRRIELGAGECFGEMALLDQGAVHSGRVSAASPLKGVAIRRDDFDALLESEPRISRSLLRVLARRLAAAN